MVFYLQHYANSDSQRNQNAPSARTRRWGLRCPDWTHKIATCVVSLKQFGSSVKYPGWRKVRVDVLVHCPLVSLTCVGFAHRCCFVQMAAVLLKHSDNRKTSQDARNVLGRLISGHNIQRKTLLVSGSPLDGE